MWASDSIEKVLQLLQDKAQGAMNMNELGQAMGIDPSQAGRFLRGTTKAELGRILGVLDLLEIPAPFFFKIALKHQEYGPADVLSFFREDPREELCDFLKRYDSLVRILEPTPEPAGTSQWRRKLLQQEDRRFADPIGAGEKLEELAGGWLTFTESAMPSREMLGDIATAVAIWASVMRLRNRRADAVKAMSMAFRLGKLSGDLWVMGLVYQKGAYLLMDLGATEEGLEFLDEAMKFFTLCRNKEWKAKIYVDYAVLLQHIGRSEEAIRWLELALEELPKSLRRYRLSAFHTLAIAMAGLGRNTDAAEALAQAMELQPDYPRAKAYLGWAKADLQMAAGAVANAAASYQHARAIILELEHWADAAIITVDLAKALLRLGDKRGLAELGGETYGLTKKLSRHKATTEMLRRFALECSRGGVKEALLQDLATRLRATFPERRPHLDQS